jgi:hypothetical protein
LPFELYQFKENFFIQIRSPFKDLKKFSQDFIEWYKKTEAKELIILSSLNSSWIYDEILKENKEKK